MKNSQHSVSSSISRTLTVNVLKEPGLFIKTNGNIMGNLTIEPRLFPPLQAIEHPNFQKSTQKERTSSREGSLPNTN